MRGLQDVRKGFPRIIKKGGLGFARHIYSADRAKVEASVKEMRKHGLKMIMRGNKHGFAAYQFSAHFTKVHFGGK